MGIPWLPNPDVPLESWIMRNVPSFIGKVPHEWTEAVIVKLRQFGIRDEVIRGAFKITRAKGMAFERPLGRIGEFDLAFPMTTLPAYRPPPAYTPPSMGSVHPNQWDLFHVKQALGKMEDQYVKAKVNGDIQMLEPILVAAGGLVWEYVKAKMKGRKIASEVEFAQEWDQAVHEAFQHAYNLESNLRRLTRVDLRELRSMDRGPRQIGTSLSRMFRLRIPELRSGVNEEEEGEGEAD